MLRRLLARRPRGRGGRTGAVSATFLVATDARRKEVYWAAYDESGARLDGPVVDRPGDVATERPVVGEGAVLYPDVFPRGRAAAARRRLAGPCGRRRAGRAASTRSRSTSAVPTPSRPAARRRSRDRSVPPRPTDVAAIVALEAELFGADAWSARPGRARSSPAAPTGACLVAEDDGRGRRLRRRQHRRRRRRPAADRGRPAHRRAASPARCSRRSPRRGARRRPDAARGERGQRRRVAFYAARVRRDRPAARATTATAPTRSCIARRSGGWRP